MKILGNEIKPGMIIEHNNDIWEVLKTQHVKPGKGGAFNQVEMKSVNKSTKLNERFRSSDTIEKANIEELKFSYLYKDESNYYFMDSKTFDQVEIKKELFVPKKDMDLVYSDSDILINTGRNIIRTFVLAKMLDKCNFKKNNTILVIGCLTGYTLAIISKLVNYVFGIDNDKGLTQIANENVNNLNILNCSVFYKKDLSTGLEKNAPYDKIFIEGSVEKVPDNLLKQLKEDGEIFTVIKNKEVNYVGEFVRGLKVGSGISIEKFFNTNVNELKDFII